MIRLRKTLKPRIPGPLAAVAAVLLALTAMAGANPEFINAGIHKAGLLNASSSTEDGGRSGESFKSALFLFRLR
jgi:hypothetical protein